ncbi:hypothetical protein DL93DRAFT_138798 [Clavulina sp. PMI_390]|nr:hypothetical protein DL93DRAFT_138798 [Clavulina sp. PMI_390]
MPSPLSMTIVLRMTEPAHRDGEQLKLMSLFAAVFTPSAEHPPIQRPSIPPLAQVRSHKIMPQNQSHLSYWPHDRWTVWSEGPAETETIFTSGKAAEHPRVSLSFRGMLWQMDSFHIVILVILFSFLRVGYSVSVWGPPSTSLLFPPGGLEICVDQVCDSIDAYHIYLNKPVAASLYSANLLDSTPESGVNNPNSPVLLWSRDNLDYSLQHDVVVTLVAKDPPLSIDHGDLRKGFLLDHVSFDEVIIPPSPSPRPTPPPSPPSPPPESPSIWPKTRIILVDISMMLLYALKIIAGTVIGAIILAFVTITLLGALYVMAGAILFLMRAGYFVNSWYLGIIMPLVSAQSKLTLPGELDPLIQEPRSGSGGGGPDGNGTASPPLGNYGSTSIEQVQSVFCPPLYSNASCNGQSIGGAH